MSDRDSAIEVGMTYCSTTCAANQGELFDLIPEDGPEPSEQQRHGEQRRFVSPSHDELFIGARTLRGYLEDCGQLDIVRLAKALDALDWTQFEAKYDGPGRPPYAPRLMAGLVMYGLLKGVNSLRALESLSQLDLGCMWICAGIQPDHSNIGRFVLRHQDAFEGDFFEQVTQLALRVTKSSVQDVAGDGTVMQAAASRYRTVKREALDRKLAAAQEAEKQAPHDPERAASRVKYEAADAALTDREDKRKAKGKPVDSLRVSTTEPQATIQPLKNKSYAPSYKPSVLANAARVIVAKAVDPSDESSVVSTMLDAAEAIGQSKVQRLMLDGNYCNETILNEAVTRDIDLLCPEQGETPNTRQKLKKSDFHYNEDRDVYSCPAGHELTARSRANDGSYVQYERHGCSDCSLRPRCFSQKSSRRVIRRLPIDQAKDALREVMAQPMARKAYAKRKAMVEPVFSFMAGVMNLRRFRRRGLHKVRLEFSLHAAAYNMGRILAAHRALLWLRTLWAMLTRLHIWTNWALSQRSTSRPRFCTVGPMALRDTA